MQNQHELALILKGKGIGPQGSRALNTEQLQNLSQLLEQGNNSIITRATLLTAFLLLPNTKEEQEWFEHSLSQELWDREMNWIWQKDVAIPPGNLPKALRQALAQQELDPALARLALGEILEQKQSPWMSAAFLEAMRLKRETLSENRAFWQELLTHSRSQTVDLPFLLDIAETYDGYQRSPALSPFLAALLAEIGIPTVLHSAPTMAPKDGINSHQICRCLGIDPLMALDQGANRLMNPQIGWAYMDQSVFFPELWQLADLRREMVKRPFLATFEKMLLPLRAQSNAMLIGYTHPAYLLSLSELLDESDLVQQFAVIRGAEGSTRPSLARKSKYRTKQLHQVIGGEWSPESLTWELGEEEICKWNAQETAIQGKLALGGQPGPIRNMLQAWASALVQILWPERTDLPALIQKTLQEGSACHRLL